jgi:uncharacterized membrane protein YfcA
MNTFDVLQPVYAVSGFVVGTLVGLTGIGSGSLITPLLILLFGVSPATAVGTDLLHVAVTKAAGSFLHGFNQTIDWCVVRRLATGSIPITVVTIALLRLLDINSPAGRDLINAALTVALIVTAATLLFRDRLIARYSARLALLAPRRTMALTIIAGGVLGLVVSISSIGAGAIGVTVLFFALSETADGADRRLRYCTRGSADACRRHWTLAAGRGRLAGICITDHGIGAWNSARQLRRCAHAGADASRHPGRNVVVVATKLSSGLVSPATNVAAVNILTSH